ncbi:hypothetical protein [Poseidonocella sp. HB161398]|uniref:hypothetical protein n=1 Tax=Poseidonocella sp. HB161398 TaxID=2320855 RepID=UPI00110A08E3|nr:hypothetical protein [Poseidonocella sp. HB161398]
MTTTVSGWPSLRRELELSERLFGSSGPARLGAWLAGEAAKVGDAAFARLFSDHIDLPGIAPGDYAHRHLRSRRGALLGGIRFYGRDIARPFVEIVAHSFGETGTLAAVAAAEWRAFAPRAMRLRLLPGDAMPGRSRIDTSIHAARYDALRPPPPGLRLLPFSDPCAALALVAGRFAHMAAADPALRRNVSPLDPRELIELWEAGQVHGISPDGSRAAGLIAVAPGSIGWIEGDEIMEEVVAVPASGRGLAAAAQGALAARDGADPGRLLIGTIDGLNTASRRSAERAGRPRVLDHVFVALPGPGQARP